jgi:hypothetical protein
VNEEEFAGTARFRLLRKIGSGGMGVVYRVHDREHGRDVALKTLRRFRPSDLYRFKSEFRALAHVSHPNLITLYELVSEGARWFFTMELIEGVSFRDWVSPSRQHAFEFLSSSLDTPSGRVQDRTLGQAIGPSTRSGRELRPAPPCDFDRLRPALLQLALGVDALHRAGRLHRDIKPSNVLVTNAGRVVLLDFGLVTEHLTVDPRDSIGGSVIGTPAYMSPEQAASEKLDPASDWYSVGVMLYEALTARLPFEGTTVDVLLRKQSIDAPRPSDSVRVPADLDALCSALLSRRPRDRPNAASVLAQLGAAPRMINIARDFVVSGSVFVGRLCELETLMAAYGAAQEGNAFTVHVDGGSGMGKTALVERFLDGVRADPRATVLMGRCYERESVPYKALDSLIDALSRHLHRLGREAAALLPRDVRPLVRLFPVLKHAEAVANAPVPVIEIPDPQQLRRRAFVALKELFARTADRGPLVLSIDDLQWGDVDSAALLRDLTAPPDAPAMLLVLSYRTEDIARSPCIRAMRAPECLASAAVREIHVGPLSADEARQLVLAVRPNSDAARAEKVVKEAEGNPLFVGEMVRHDALRRLTLDEMLFARIDGLDADARRLLEVIALAGAPIEATTALRAAATLETGMTALALLRAERLVRAAGIAEQVEPYHDRIRETVTKHMKAERLRECHAALACALESAGGADPEALAVHLHAAGDFVEAGRYAAQAARSAAEALAFDRAVRLFRLALELAEADDPERHRLQIELATSLANAGRSREAARAFLAAADAASPPEALEFRRRGADQYLKGGHLREGIETLRSVLEPMGLRIAPSPRRALIGLLFGRARLRLRGLSHRECNPSEIDPKELTRIDACRSASVGLSMVDIIQGADFQARHTLLALRAGEPSRIAVALALEAAHTVYVGGLRAHRRGERIITSAEEIARRVGRPYPLAFVELTRGIMEFCQGHWRPARDCCDRAAAILRDGCTEVAWETDTACMFSIWARIYLGEVRELARELNGLLDDAQLRGDLYAQTALRTSWVNTGWLAADEFERARCEVERGRQHWSYEGFQLQHYWLLRGEGNLDLYAGNASAAWKRIHAAWPAFQRSKLPRVRVARLEMVQLRGVSALASAIEVREAERNVLVDIAQRAAAELVQGPIASFKPLGLLLRAGVMAVRAEPEHAASLLEDAGNGFEATEMALYAAVARRRHGEIIGDAAGRNRVRAANEWMAAHGIRNPDRFSQMLAPGFGAMPGIPGC